MRLLFSLFPSVCLFLALNLTVSTAGDLTPQQRESLKAQMKQIKESLDQHISTRNTDARSIFSRASSDPRAAVDLYLECYKKVNYTMENRSDADFRAWKETQEERLRDKAFVQSLMLQLRYLALSCHAAEVEEIDEVFGPLTQYVESLSQLDEMPDQVLLQGVSGSIFAKAFFIEDMLSSNEGWEQSPFNIPGMYQRTILPHLRANQPDALMNAWDRRIAQQKRIVMFFEEKKEEALRGLDRDEKVKARDRQERRGGIVGSHDIDEFTRETLPRLIWDKHKDMYQYIDQLEAAKAMLLIVKENLKGENGEFYYDDFMSTISGEGEATETPEAAE